MVWVIQDGRVLSLVLWVNITVVMMVVMVMVVLMVS